MGHLSHDLFLLMVNLSQMQSKDRALLIFINAINSIFPTLTFNYQDQDTQNIHSTMPVATSTCNFGSIEIVGDFDQLPEESQMLLQNAVQMLAVILEKLQQQELLSNEKKLMSDLVTERTDELNRQKDAFKTLTESSPDIIAKYDLNGNFLYVSGNVTDYFNIDPFRFIGKRPRELNLPEELSEFWEREIGNVLKTSQIQSNTYTYERNNIKRYFDLRTIPEFDHKGHIISILAISRDITEQKKFEDELIRAKMIAEQSDKLKSCFLANISHEIRTPMNSIVGFTKLLKNNTLNAKTRTRYFEIIETSIKMLLNTINDIMEYSQIEAGDVNLNIEEVNLNECFKELYKKFLLIKKDNDQHTVEITYSLGLSDDDSVIYTDSYRLNQILTKVLDNALKYTEEGSIKFGYELQNGLIRFFIKDTGIGISSDKQQVIFEKFRQEDESKTRLYGGLGLGLTISKKYVELLGGRIWVSSQKGAGTELSFTLPYEPVVSSVNLFEESIRDEEIYHFEGKHILIVEDVEVSVELLEEMFSDTGARLTIAKDGLSALAKCTEQNDIDLVLMDIQIPKLDGYAATERIKKIRPDLPIIAQTAYANTREKENALQHGCDDYIAKPFVKEELMELIKKHL